MAHDFPILKDLLLLLVASLPVVFLFNRFRLPTILGFMITGVIVGPQGLRLIADAGAIEALAEIGVVLLMFTIGLEFSLRRIVEMRRLVLGGGGLQVALTALAVALVAYLLDRPLSQAIFFGFLVAPSSTAVVLKSYLDRGETHTPHARAGVGVLLFQDLCVVPIMVMIPVLGQGGGASLSLIIGSIGAALGAIALIVFTTRSLVPRLLDRVAALRSPEVSSSRRYC